MGAKYLRNITKILKSASGVLYGRVTAGTGRGEEITFASIPALIGVYTTAQVDSIIGGIEGLTSADIDTLAEINAILTDADLASVSYVDNGLSGKQATLVSGTNIKTVNSTSLLGSGDITVGLSGTGSVDNAALRADGTGGATLQSSAWIINDNLTASPNNTVNHACLEATGGTTNVSVSLKPKGSGAFSLHAPDGTSTGGNVRGANASDLQTSRSAATQVASGTGSFLFSSINCTASGNYSAAGGLSSTASGSRSFCYSNSSTVSGNFAACLGGSSNVVSGEYAFVGGSINCSVSGTYAQAMGVDAVADRFAQYTHAPFRWGGGYNRHGYIRLVGGGKTTNATPTVLTLDNSSATVSIGSGSVCAFEVHVIGVKSDGSGVAEYRRRVRIKNVGGTTSLVGSVETVGTDHEDNASTDVSIAENNTSDILEVTVTGIAAETWRWYLLVEGGEIAYGT